MKKRTWAGYEKQLWAASQKEHLPLAGAFELTYRCNFDCVHCYLQDSREQAELGAAQWCALVDEVAAAGTLFLTLTGGEPMLHRGFDAIYERAIRSGLLVTLFTNGSTLTKQRVRWLAKLPPRTLEVSLYGMSARTYRRVTGRADHFAKVMRGVRLAVDAGLSVHLKAMAFDETVADLEKMKELAKRLGPSFRVDTLLHGTLGGSRSPAEHRLAPAKAVRLEVEAALGSKQPPRPKPRFGDHIYQCGAGRSAYTIAPDGALQLCTLVRNPRVRLLGKGFRQAWDELRRETERRFSAGSKCGSCALRARCSTCPGVASIETGSDEAPVGFLCETARLRCEERAGVGG